MADTTPGTHPSITRLIFVPAAITLAITILRLVGELRHWPTPWFSNSAGGGGAIVGIVWLVFILGPYFALKLAGSGEAPASSGKAIGFAVLGIVLAVLGGFLGFAPKPAFPGKMLLGLLLIIAGAAVQFNAWPALAKTLLAYGFAARIPVAIVMFFAIRANWGTHYDALAPGYSGPMSFWGKYFQIALVPQLVGWVVFTIVIGSLFGSVVAAIAHRRPAPQTAS